MARQAKNSMKKFEGLKNSPAMQDVEDIYEANEAEREARIEAAASTASQDSNETEVAPTPELPDNSGNSSPSGQSKVLNGTRVGLKPLKAEKGVKIALPIDYYFKLVQIKACVGKSLQDLAAQGVMEFIDRFQSEQGV